VVAFGASARRLEAFQDVLTALPDDTGMAFVLIQHLDRHHESVLTELLAKHTLMRVAKVHDGMPIQPNTVHVIPPNSGMIIKDGALHLIARP